MAEEIVLLGLLAAFALLYVIQRAQLFYYAKQARRMVAELAKLEAALVSGESLTQQRTAEAAVAWLERMERKLTAGSRHLIDWRSSEVERWIIGKQIDVLLYEYERAGAMTTRLIALLARRSSLQRIDRRPGPGLREASALVE